MQGYARKLGAFINTDEHASDKYLPAGTSIEDVRRQMFSSLRPGFSGQVAPGDFIVAGEAFGTVSSRVDAAINIRELGIKAVLATSFGMLFFRNAINIGLPCIECATGGIAEGELLQIDLASGVIRRAAGQNITFSPFPPVIMKLLNDGGLLPHIKKNKGYTF